VRYVTLIGNPKPESRTHRVATEVTRALIEASGGPPPSPSGAGDVRHEVVDLSGLACRLLVPQASAAIEDAVESVISADVLVVASPVFKGTYTGLLKVFLDRLGYRALSSVTALPVLVMKHPEHALAVEVHLRPLLVELGAMVPTPGLAVFESDFGRLEHVAQSWARRVGRSLPGAAEVRPAAKVRAEGNGRAPRPRPPRVPAPAVVTPAAVTPTAVTPTVVAPAVVQPAVVAPAVVQPAVVQAS
jgi:FMN reductase